VDVNASASVRVSGNVTVGGNITGTVEAGGDVEVSGDVSGGGKLTAGANLTIDGKISGEVEAGGSVTLTTPGTTLNVNGSINGSVTVTRKATVNVGEIRPENPVTVNVEASPLTGVSISVNNTVADVSIIMDSLGGKPTNIAENPPGGAYDYIQIDAGNLSEGDIGDATIEFSVEKSWLVELGISAGNVVLSRYRGGAWSTLTVGRTGENATHVNYEATTPGFSVFAITGEKEAGLPLTLIVGAAVAIAIVGALIAVALKRRAKQ